MLDHVLVYINGRRHEVRGPAALLSLSDYLRRTLGLTGTKIVCSEGDCGACSVLIGRPNRELTQIQYRPVDACIQFMFQLESTHIVTVEGLGDETSLCAVQQAMVDCHGSQCGFCTPGFVVAMAGFLEEHESLAGDELRHGLTGNLCRCTGYAPILEAGREIDMERHERIAQRFPSVGMLEEFAIRRDKPIEVEAECEGAIVRVAAPHDLKTALAFLAARPDAAIVAGATDIGVRINKTLTLPRMILDLNRIAELDGVTIKNGEMILGARATWTAIERACAERVPELHKIVSVFGAPQIRHVGTIGGNIANASPIADSLPFLYVTETVLELASATGRREVNINDFYHGYKKLDLRRGELITRVRVPLPADDELFKLYKVSRRRDLDISTFTAAVRMRLDGDTISDAAIAFGGVAPVVIRARRTEAFLRGQPFAEEALRQAGEIAVDEIAPISDVRGAADYRYQLTRNILQKFYHDSQMAAVMV